MKTETKRSNKAYIVIIIILFVLLIGGVSFLLFGRDILPTNEENTLKEEFKEEEIVSQDLSSVIEEVKVKEFTELFGYDLLEVNEENPSITLRNSSNNKVLLKYEIFNGDELIYTSDLLKPGDILKLNVYELLDFGEHSLEYHISSYDTVTQNQITSDIIQKQKINIS